MMTNRKLITLFIPVMLLLAITAISPYDRNTWLMEVAPVLIVMPVLLLTCRRFPLTTLLYVLIALHAVILICGGAYTYARVPLGYWLQDIFSMNRNPYDRIGNFMQGFVPALAAREVLLRGGYLTSKRLTAFICLCIALAISACYELIEWGAALALGQAADDFLGTQGDQWDTQWDMFMCLIGASTVLLVLSGTQDRQIEKIEY